MPTFLTNAKMSHALRARIEASLVRPGSSRAALAPPPQVTAVVRFLLVAAILTALVILGITYRNSRRDFAAEKQLLLDRIARSEALLTPAQLRRQERLFPLLERVVQASSAEFTADRVSRVWATTSERAPLLGARMLYGRGELSRLSDRGTRIAALEESGVDAFATCLLTPPTSLKESALLRAAHEPLRSGRVTPLAVALHLIEEPAVLWTARARNTQRTESLRTLVRSFELLHSETQVEAANGQLLLLLVDEPKERGVPSDLDGESRHFVRVALFDLNSGTEHLWLRRLVDPSNLSDRVRVDSSRALDSCKLAKELHDLPAPVPPR